MPHDHRDIPSSAPFGHNAAGHVAQWQTPHTHDDDSPPVPASTEPDFDLVEEAFADAFPKAEDPTSFLRLANVPFVGARPDGSRLFLLRVEQDFATDIGSLAPAVGGGAHRYAPMPKGMVSRRRRLGFVYTDGDAVVCLSLSEARALWDQSPDESAHLIEQ